MTEKYPGNGESQNGDEQLSEAELFNKAALTYEENLTRIVRRLIGEEVASNAVWKKELSDETLANLVDNPEVLDTYLNQPYSEFAGEPDPDITLFDDMVDSVEYAVTKIPNQYDNEGFRVRNVQFIEEEGGRISLGRQASDHRYWQSIILESESESIRVIKNNSPMGGDVPESILPPDIPDVNTAGVIDSVNRASAVMEEWLALDDQQLRQQIEG